MDRGTAILGALLATALVAAAGCGGSGTKQAEPPRRSAATCPSAWRSGWQRLADRVQFPVYCPAWVPSPLTGRIGGSFSSGPSVDKDRSYLAGFIWFERGSGEVHVNLRGYPNRKAVPSCLSEEQAGRRVVKRKIPCFGDAKGTQHIGGSRATLYTVNRDADQWHLLYLWRRDGSLYTLSEHVAPPYGYQRVLKNLDRMLRNLVLVEPSSR